MATSHALELRRRLLKTGNALMVARLIKEICFENSKLLQNFSIKITDIQHKYEITILLVLKEMYKYGLTKRELFFSLL
jgi:predicted DNA-binding transcriptional regulator